jgi:ABC-2 type transport system permease protein
VLACITDRIPMEIGKGKLSELLLKPFSHLGYWATQDAASKSLNLVSAVGEVTIFALLVSSPLYVPHSLGTWAAFAAATLAAMVIYFQLSYLLGVMGFWASQSWGPRFCFEIILEFCAGAYFPIDLLPLAAQKVLNVLPFPYLIYYPVSIYLERLSGAQIATCLITQAIWIAVLSVAVRFGWKAGLRHYAAEGA